MTAAGEVRYTRDMPEAWAGLHALATERIDAHGYSVAAASAVCEGISRLDDETLEENRYFGLGGSMAGIALTLSDVGRATSLVEGICDGIWSKSYSLPDRVQGGIRISDLVWLDSGSLVGDIHDVALEASRSTPDADRMLTNALQAAAFKRPRGPGSPGPGLSRDDALESQARECVRNEPAARVIGNALFGGSSIIMRHALYARYSGSIRSHVAPLFDTTPPIKHIVTAEEVRALDLSRVAKFAAMLRLDEFTAEPAALDDLLTATGDPVRVLDIRTDWIDTPPPPRVTESDGRPVVLHRQRLRCPALQVGGLVNLVMALQKEIVVGLMEW